MYIKDLVLRDFKDDVTYTASSFKTWDTCMDNKTCKIVAIVGIVLASLVALWIVTTLVRCVCLGANCLEALCCCCCRSANSPRYVEKQSQDPYQNPNMYAPVAPPVYVHRGVQPQAAPPTSQPQQAYFTNNQGYEPVRNNPYETDNRSYYTDEGPFADKNTTHYTGYEHRNF